MKVNFKIKFKSIIDGRHGKNRLVLRDRLFCDLHLDYGPIRTGHVVGRLLFTETLQEGI